MSLQEIPEHHRNCSLLRRAWAVGAVTCAGALYLANCCPFWEHARSAASALSCGNLSPRLTIRKHVIRLDDGNPGQVVYGSIAIENTGAGELQFDAKRSCGCTTLEPSRGAVAAGRVSDIKVGIRLPEYANSERSVHVDLTSNDPVTSNCRVTFLARSRALIDVTPSALYFGQLELEEVPKVFKILTLRDRSGKPIRDPKSLSVQSIAGRLMYDWIKQPDGAFVLRVSLAKWVNKPATSKELRDKLVITAHGEGVPCVVPAYATLDEDVTLVPSTIFLSRSGPKSRYNPATVLIRSKWNLGALLSVTPCTEAQVADGGTIAPGVRLLKISCPSGVPQHTGGFISLRFEHFCEPLRVLVQAL